MNLLFKVPVELCVHARDALRAVAGPPEEPAWPQVVCLDCGSWAWARRELGQDVSGPPDLRTDPEPVEQPAGGGLAGQEQGQPPVPGPGALPVGQEPQPAVVLVAGQPRPHELVHGPQNAPAGQEASNPQGEPKPPGQLTIRALADIPPFVEPDNLATVRLKAGDVATVPTSIARLLERRQKAVVVEEAVPA